MKKTEKIKDIERHMAAGKITRDGFLGTDGRSLEDILLADDAAVGRLGVTHAALASRMTALRDAGAAGLGDFVKVEGTFEVRVDSARGKLPCPFRDPGMHRKTNITVRNLDLNEEITFTDLNIHLIAAHGFYQGNGSPYRIAPADLVRILAIGTSRD